MKMPEDPFVVELLPEFLETWQQDIKTQLPVILKERDAKELYRFGHTIKGSCLQFGFDETAQLGIELMGCSKEENWEKAIELEKKIIEAFNDIKVFVDTQINK
ncbi:MAG: Hpt domain-containing protein [bacterium]